VNPKLVACSFIASGLRVFNIEDVTKPREVAYFVAPVQAKPENGGEASNFAMSQPAFAPARHEIWWTDGTSGFYALRLTNGAWPEGADRSELLGVCRSATRKTFTLRLRGVRWVRASVGKERVRVLKVRRGKRSASVTVSTAGLRSGKLKFRIKLKNGKTVDQTRSFLGCR
jgi:hypothetical protein